MPERFSSRAKDTEDEPLCTRCQHPERHHKRPGMCTGLGDEKAALGSFCGCVGFQRPPTTSNSYSTYVPPPPTERAGFSQSSSRNQIGDGRPVGRPNLQHKQTVGGATPDWVMFGVRKPDGSVMVFASTSLSYLELRQEAGHFDDVFGDEIRLGRIAPTPWDIRGRMVDYVIVTAPTYNEAIRALFTKGWRPDGEPTTEDLQREAALEEAREAAAQEERERLWHATEPRAEIESGVWPKAGCTCGATKRWPEHAASCPLAKHEDDDIIDAEIVEEG